MLFHMKLYIFFWTIGHCNCYDCNCNCMSLTTIAMICHVYGSMLHSYVICHDKLKLEPWVIVNFFSIFILITSWSVGTKTWMRDRRITTMTKMTLTKNISRKMWTYFKFIEKSKLMKLSLSKNTFESHVSNLT